MSKELALNVLDEVTEDELEEVLGAGKNGSIYSISHECHWNTWQFIFTCCS